MRHKHVHTMYPIAVSYSSSFFGTPSPLTYVLWRCGKLHGPDCVRATMLSGKWTMADIGSDPPRAPQTLVEQSDDPALASR